MNFYYWLGYHLARWAGRLLFRFRIIHRERMIQTGPVILAMNHQSYLDPPLAGTACDRAIYFLAKKTLLENPLLRWLLPKLNVIPVDQKAVDRGALKALMLVNERLESELQQLYAVVGGIGPVERRTSALH